MSFKSTAQELVVIDPSSIQEHLQDREEGDSSIPIVPLELSMEPDEGEELESGLEVFDEGDPEASAEGNHDIMIELSDLPGAPAGTQDPQEPEAPLEVSEEISEADDNDSKKSKKNEKWDWESKGPHGFVAWVKSRIDDIPKHSGYDSAGLERAMSYMEKLDSEISRAMRLDLDGELDANKIEEVRAKIDDGISRLHARLEKVKKTSKTRRKKKAETEFGIVKEGQKITGVQGVFVTVDLLTSRIARVCINGMVSAGHDIEEIYKNQIEKYKLNDREQAQVMQLLADMGYPLRQDRGYLPDEDQDVADGKFDWASNYKG